MTSSASSSLLMRVARNTTSSVVLGKTMSPVFRRSLAFLTPRMTAFPYPRQPFPSELLLPRLNAASTFSTSSCAHDALGVKFSPPPTQEHDEFDADVERGETIPDSSMPFTELQGKVHENTFKAITVRPFKYTHLSPVQEQILPLLPELALPYKEFSTAQQAGEIQTPRDLLVKAKTGTGKTMAFLVPAIEARIKSLEACADSTVSQLASHGVGVRPAVDKSRAMQRFAIENVGTLVISPTRELATQIAVEALNLSSHHRGFSVQVLLGGESRGRQLREWQGRKDIVVATPGRLLDLLSTEEQVRAAFKGTKLLVLDEADTLYDMGFRNDIETIASYLPRSPERQTFLFSATVSSAIESIAKSTLSRSHQYINCVSADDSPVHAHIPQYHTVLASGEQSLPHLLRLIAHDQLARKMEGGKSKIIVFFSTTKMVQMFAEMVRMSVNVLPCGKQTSIYEMHSKRDMDRRISTSRAFRRDEAQGSVLITSDVSARGVDYPGVTRVIQMGLPASKDMYVHRVGRTGRGGKRDGRGDLVISPWEMGFLQKKMGDVGLMPVTVDALKAEVEELAKETVLTPEISNRPYAPGRRTVQEQPRSYLPALSGLESTAFSTATSMGSQEVGETFMSQLGFFLGHQEALGLRLRDVVDGLGKYFQEMGGLQGPPAMSRAMEERLRSGVAKGFQRDRHQRDRRPAWGTYATGRDGRGLGRGERQRSPWESDTGGSGFRGEAGGERDRRRSRFSDWERRDDRGSGLEDRGGEGRWKGNGGVTKPHWAGRGSLKSKRDAY